MSGRARVWQFETALDRALSGLKARACAMEAKMLRFSAAVVLSFLPFSLSAPNITEASRLMAVIDPTRRSDKDSILHGNTKAMNLVEPLLTLPAVSQSSS